MVIFYCRILEEEILKETKRIQTDLIRKVGREEEEDRIEWPPGCDQLEWRHNWSAADDQLGLLFYGYIHHRMRVKSAKVRENEVYMWPVALKV